ncbi:MAG: hypothetical protein BA863_06005 [Desulfovibrio sp. S3730MH75]|nr:MAG: hypothetical protein BA863_06005 [Desulfovibrio sp. S3730MH75]
MKLNTDNIDTDKILLFLQKLPTTLAAIMLITWSKPYSRDLPPPEFWGYPLTMPMRIGLAALGGAFLYFSLFHIKGKKHKAVEVYDDQICSKCSKVYMAGYADKGAMCTECEIPLEVLVGFYERHPELKDIEDPPPAKEDDTK